jgi:hypothetical protein
MKQKDLKVMDATDGREYLVMVPHGWGRRGNAFEAFKEAKRHMGYAPDRPTAVVLDVPEGAWVNEMGGVCWDDSEVERPVEVGRLTFANPRPHWPVRP